MFHVIHVLIILIAESPHCIVTCTLIVKSGKFINLPGQAYRDMKAS